MKTTRKRTGKPVKIDMTFEALIEKIVVVPNPRTQKGKQAKT